MNPEPRIADHAPELLELLREMVAVYDGDESYTREDYHDLHDRARALVTKLTQ